MRAFKFRSSAQMEFILDIIENQRLRCSLWNKLNDPMEGLFTYNAPRAGREAWLEQRLQAIRDEKGRRKICSLSRDFQSHLLWVHYAGGFDGVAIEVELPNQDMRIQPVNYERGVRAFCDIEQRSERELAQLILFSKYREWSYEKEIRILQDGDWYPIGRPPTRVIAGHRVSQPLFRMLGMMCHRAGIEFARVEIGDKKIEAVPVDEENLDRPKRSLRGRKTF